MYSVLLLRLHEVYSGGAGVYQYSKCTYGTLASSGVVGVLLSHVASNVYTYLRPAQKCVILYREVWFLSIAAITDVGVSLCIMFLFVKVEYSCVCGCGTCTYCVYVSERID